MSRVLLVGHAAPGIALGKMLQADGDIRRARSFDIRAGTASLSKYVLKEGKWEQVYNGIRLIYQTGPNANGTFPMCPRISPNPGCARTGRTRMRQKTLRWYSSAGRISS